ncbi:MAG: hypothetical protein OXP09_08340 [Gammaproteobacteria bacterium]|nr:hypothetical protein [Gammaproteobacteria bacterium]
MAAAVDGLRRLQGVQGTLAGARKISESALDSFYGVARELYANGHYAEALQSFELLCLYEHDNVRNWHALGVCRQVTGDYGGAAAALTFAVDQFDDTAPGLRLALAECLILCGALAAAGNVLGEIVANDDTLNERERGKVKLLESRLTEPGRES